MWLLDRRGLRGWAKWVKDSGRYGLAVTG